ncbi:MAG: amidohydrolase family protein [Alphaproteobacteria bacterium]|nr:amidohydrolase family protein [Alphaproteobacteria bacterium]
MRIDAHHHLWDLNAVDYPWLMAKGQVRFFGDPAPIQRNYLLSEFRTDAEAFDIAASVHIQVGARDGLAEARWVQSIADSQLDWPLVQVAFCDLTADDRDTQLDQLATLSSVRGVRQIVGRAPQEDQQTGTNALLDDPAFLAGLRNLAVRNLSFDLQLIPELMPATAVLLEQVPELPVVVCHAGSPHDRTAGGLRDWTNSLRHLSRLPNVFCKLSGLGMFEHDWTPRSVQPIVETCLEQFGSHRCMFGSNFPVDSLSSTYAKIVDTYQGLVPQSDHRTVFGDTARRFYRM